MKTTKIELTAQLINSWHELENGCYVKFDNYEAAFLYTEETKLSGSPDCTMCTNAAVYEDGNLVWSGTWSEFRNHCRNKGKVNG